jgi:hypothetical protein
MVPVRLIAGCGRWMKKGGCGAALEEVVRWIKKGGCGVALEEVADNDSELVVDPN